MVAGWLAFELLRKPIPLAFVLKYLLFFPEEYEVVPNMSTSLGLRRVSENEYVTEDVFSSLSEDKKSRALVRSMSEILFLCGSNEKAVISSLNILDGDIEGLLNAWRMREEKEVMAELELRPINSHCGLLPRAHGSALFTRGETQKNVTSMDTINLHDGEAKNSFCDEEYKKDHLMDQVSNL